MGASSSPIRSQRLQSLLQKMPHFAKDLVIHDRQSISRSAKSDSKTSNPCVLKRQIRIIANITSNLTDFLLLIDKCVSREAPKARLGSLCGHAYISGTGLARANARADKPKAKDGSRSGVSYDPGCGR